MATISTSAPISTANPAALTLTRVRTVVEEVENPAAELTVAEAQAHRPGAVLGDEITDEVPPVDMGRIAAQSAKQVILQKVREAERERQYEEFKDRAGTIINGIVKREEYGNVIVDVGRGEAMLRRNDKIGRESYRNGDRIRCYIKDVRRETARPADLPVAHRARIHGRIVQDGSAGNLRRHHRDQGRGPRSRVQPRQDRRDFL
jgi:hypothetical protein